MGLPESSIIHIHAYSCNSISDVHVDGASHMYQHRYVIGPDTTTIITQLFNVFFTYSLICLLFYTLCRVHSMYMLL